MTDGGGEFSVDDPYAGEEAHFVPAFIGDVAQTPEFGRDGQLVRGGMLVGGLPPPMHGRPPAPAGEFALDSGAIRIPVFDERGNQIGVSVVGTPVHNEKGEIVAVEGEDQEVAADPLARLRQIAGVSDNGASAPVSEDAPLFVEDGPPAPTPPPVTLEPEDDPAVLIHQLRGQLVQLRGDLAETIVEIAQSIADVQNRLDAVEQRGLDAETVTAITTAIEAVNGRVSVLTSFTERAVGTTIEASRAGSSIVGEI